MTATSVEGRAALEAAGREHVDKRMSAAEAARLIVDGDHVAIGGTLYSRTPMAMLFELLRQRRRRLTLSRPLMCYEAELFFACDAAERIVTSWVGIGLPWGLSPIFRHYVEHGLAQYDEWSHLGIGLRYKAGAMGVPFLPTMTMMGSDIAAQRGLVTLQCPYTNESVLAIPALIPDVAIIHAHRADKFGSVQIDGYPHMDVDMARAAKRVIVSTEAIVPTEQIIADPSSTVLPHFVVDAVVEIPFGAYPNECYGLYEADLEHFDEYVTSVKGSGVLGAQAYVERNVSAHEDFAGFLALVGETRLAEQCRKARELLAE
jgi:glutaconate CoA-transferase, subunit A